MLNRLKQFVSRLSFAGMVKILLWMGLIGYLLAALYFYLRWGLYVVVWHTHLMFLVYVWVAGYYAFRFLQKKTGAVIFKHGLYVFTLVLFSLAVFEVSVILFDLNNKDRNHYWAPYNSRAANYYHRWKPNETHYLKTSEFTYPRTTNSLGYPDREWALEKLPGEFRILCLGDSFTEGDGASQDSSYVAFMERSLGKKFDHITLMNAGVCANDPFYNFVSLRDHLVSYQPDLIIQTLSFNDIATDFIVRGGMERFIDEGDPGKVRFRSGPWWEPLYALSYASRNFFRLAGYNYQLLNNKQMEQLMGTVDSTFTDLFRSYAELTAKHNIRVCLVLLPLKEHVDFGDHKMEPYNFTKIGNFIRDSTDFYLADLLPLYNAYVARHGLKREDVYWVYDGHHNARGYQMMAECIEQVIIPILHPALSEPKR